MEHLSIAPLRAAPAGNENGQERAVNYHLFMQTILLKIKAPFCPPHPKVFSKCNFKDLLCGKLKERDVSSPQEADDLEYIYVVFVCSPNGLHVCNATRSDV